jgi:hypothetical protein
VRPSLVALWLALQLVFAAPFARVRAALPGDGQKLAARHAHDVALVRGSDRPSHRLALQSPPFLPPHPVVTPPPDAAASSRSLPRARSRAVTGVAGLAGPRGPPFVAAS